MRILLQIFTFALIFSLSAYAGSNEEKDPPPQTQTDTSQYTKQITAITEEKNKLTQEIDKLQTQIKQLTTNRPLNDKEIKALQDELKQKAQTIQTLRDEIASITSDQPLADEKIAALNAELADKETTIAALQARIQNVDQPSNIPDPRIKDLETQLAQKQHELTELEQKLNAQIATLKAELLALKSNGGTSPLLLNYVSKATELTQVEKDRRTENLKYVDVSDGIQEGMTDALVPVQETFSKMGEKDKFFETIAKPFLIKLQEQDIVISFLIPHLIEQITEELFHEAEAIKRELMTLDHPVIKECMNHPDPEVMPYYHRFIEDALRIDQDIDTDDAVAMQLYLHDHKDFNNDIQAYADGKKVAWINEVTDGVESMEAFYCYQGDIIKSVISDPTQQQRIYSILSANYEGWNTWIGLSTIARLFELANMVQTNAPEAGEQYQKIAQGIVRMLKITPTPTEEKARKEVREGQKLPPIAKKDLVLVLLPDHLIQLETVMTSIAGSMDVFFADDNAQMLEKNLPGYGLFSEQTKKMMAKEGRQILNYSAQYIEHFLQKFSAITTSLHSGAWQVSKNDPMLNIIDLSDYVDIEPDQGLASATLHVPKSAEGDDELEDIPTDINLLELFGLNQDSLLFVSNLYVGQYSWDKIKHEAEEQKIDLSFDDAKLTLMAVLNRIFEQNLFKFFYQDADEAE